MTQLGITLRLLDTKSAAKYLGMEPGTLENWRYQSKGPHWFHPQGSRSVRYDIRDLDAWIEAGKGAA